MPSDGKSQLLSEQCAIKRDGLLLYPVLAPDFCLLKLITRSQRKWKGHDCTSSPGKVRGERQDWHYWQQKGLWWTQGCCRTSSSFWPLLDPFVSGETPAGSLEWHIHPSFPENPGRFGNPCPSTNSTPMPKFQMNIFLILATLQNFCKIQTWKHHKLPPTLKISKDHNKKSGKKCTSPHCLH